MVPDAMRIESSGRDERRGADADGTLLGGVVFLLFVDRTVVDIGIDQNGASVGAVEHLLLFEQREILADRHLRHFEPFGQSGDAYRALLLQQIHDEIVSFGQCHNRIIRYIFKQNSDFLGIGQAKSEIVAPFSVTARACALRSFRIFGGPRTFFPAAGCRGGLPLPEWREFGSGNTPKHNGNQSGILFSCTSG